MLPIPCVKGLTVTNSYDTLGRLRTRTLPDGGTESCGYSVLGVIAYTNQLGKVATYGYDAAGRHNDFEMHSDRQETKQRTMTNNREWVCAYRIVDPKHHQPIRQ